MDILRRRLAVCVLACLLPCASIAQTVRVSVFGLFHPKQLTIEPAQPMELRWDGRTERIAQGERIVLTLTRARLVLSHGESRAVATEFEITEGSGAVAEFRLSVPGKIQRRYRGNLKLQSGAAEIVPVVSMDLETAVASITAAELPSDMPAEALKAQAVAVRSYLVAGGPRHKESDFCDTTHCQFLKAPPALESPAAKAATETRGLVLEWHDKPFSAMYSASCSGRTHTLQEIGYKVLDYPYFAVECSYCLRNPERWSSRIPRADSEEAVAKNETERIRLGRELGWSAVPSNDHSQRASGDFVDLSGVGRGHGLGLCQRGAAAMAREGKRFREILGHYYPNTTLVSIESSVSH